MAHIGGNITGRFQICTVKKNAMGEGEKTWEDAVNQLGYLDLQSGDSKYSNFNAKIEESTHIFICDFNSALYALSSSDARVIFKDMVYDVLLIDNPMEMNEHLEIYLRKVGAWNG